MGLILNLQNYFESVNPMIIYWSIIVCIWIKFLFVQHLCLRERRVYVRSGNRVPAALVDTISQKTFEKARSYGIDKINITILSQFYQVIVLTTLLHFDCLYKGWVFTGPMLSAFRYWPSTWDAEVGRSICFFILAMGFNIIVGLPISIYSTFVLEERHGFNNQTVGFFIKDLVKNIVVAIVIIMSPIVGLIVKIVQAGGQFMFVWLWLFCFIVLLFFMTIYPMMIAPLFDKYTPLKEGPLRSRIEALADSISFPITKLYVVEGSKRSAHSNAYLYGFFNNKRIVLYDTLIKGYVSENKEKKEDDHQEKGAEPLVFQVENFLNEEKGCEDEEIEAVLCHEIGHWKLYHVLKTIVISQVNLFIIFCLFAFFYRNVALYQAFGFPKENIGTTKEMPIIVGFIIVLQFLLQIFNTGMGYLMIVYSRRFEFQADAFAVDLGYGDHLKSALIKLTKDNLTFPISDPLYSAWHHNHPTVLQRLDAIDAMKPTGPPPSTTEHECIPVPV